MRVAHHERRKKQQQQWPYVQKSQVWFLNGRLHTKCQAVSREEVSNKKGKPEVKAAPR